MGLNVKITVCNNYTPIGQWEEFGARASAMMDSYASANKYSRVCLTERISDMKWMGWDKIKLCLDLISTCDVLFCLDTDLFVMNHNVTVEQYLDNDNDIYIPRDHDNINIGVVILKNTPFVVEFLNHVWESRKSFPDEFQMEQAAWWASMKQYGFRRMKILPQKGINSYPYWDPIFVERFGLPESEKTYHTRQFDPVVQRINGSYTTGDLIFHMPGIPMDRRYEYLNNYEGKVIRKY